MLIKKHTHGFVTQIFDTESMECVSQSFTAGDEVEYEAPDGSPTDGSQLPYEPFNMTVEHSKSGRGTVTVLVEGGMVQDVSDLPDGWTYQVDDRDDSSRCCEVCEQSDNIVGPLSSNESHELICDECAEKGTD